MRGYFTVRLPLRDLVALATGVCIWLSAATAFADDPALKVSPDAVTFQSSRVHVNAPRTSLVRCWCIGMHPSWLSGVEDTLAPATCRCATQTDFRMRPLHRIYPLRFSS